MERIGVIGLGRMGSAIAQRMAARGHPLRTWTRSGRSLDGHIAAPDLAALARASDTLVLSLFDDTAVAQVLDTLLTLDLTGKQIIDTSTVVPAILTDRHARITAKRASAVDAPISGGPELVLAGQCGLFLGGDDAAADRALKTLSSLSSRLFHVGPLGTGLVMKTINNAMLQTYFNGLIDLLPLARRAGLPLETALRILSGGPAGVPMVADRIPRILGADDSVGFSLDAVFKDSDVFRRVVESFGLTSPMLNHFATHRDRIAAAGLLNADLAAMLRLAYDSAGDP